MKYELLKNNFIEYKGRKLYRIRALKSFSDIKCGDIGGYVENGKNYRLVSRKIPCFSRVTASLG